MHTDIEKLMHRLICSYLASPCAEIGVANGSVKNFDSNLKFLRRMNKNFLHHEGFSGTISHRS